MDTSEQYIEMCRKATELHNNHTWKPGDFYSIAAVRCEMICVGFERPFDTAIWLPRIDQYLQMLSDEKIDFGLSNYTRGDSVEIVCLKLLMSNKYNKSWNGEDWI